MAEEENKVIGYAYYNTYREKAAYFATVESTIYVHHNHHRKGIGKALYQALIEEGRKNKIHTFLAFITTTNIASVKMHEDFGFKLVGEQKEVGWKFEKFHNIFEYQLIL